MTLARYKGHADELILSKADFTRHDIDDQGKVTFTRDEDVEISQKAFDYLVQEGFPIVEIDENGEEVKPKKSATEDTDNSEGVAGTGLASPSVGGTTGPTSTGAGSSTAGSPGPTGGTTT